MNVKKALPRAVLMVGLLAPALAVVGALGARLAAWDFETGLQFVFTAAFAALLVCVAVLVSMVGKELG